MNKLRADSIKDYLKSVNKLFVERGYEPPINFGLKHKAQALFYENVHLWETDKIDLKVIDCIFPIGGFTSANIDSAALCCSSLSLVSQR